MSKKQTDRQMSSRKRADSTYKTPDKITSEEYLAQEGYQIGRLLGEGSYCKVRRATQGDKRMAVKIITRENQSDDFVRRFLPRELDILRKVKHKNIIQVKRIVNFPHRVYIFMELVERGDLLDYIRTRGRLGEAESRHYFSQLVSAVRYLHGLSVAHRDLKCENILVTDDDNIKIIDFGFCRNTVDSSGKRELSRTYCGSTAYAAPEVLQGTPYNPMMYDVWSLGCVLFIMLTGTMPFDDSNIRRMVNCQLKRALKFPHANQVTINPSAKNLIRHMLEPDITRRSTLDQVNRHDWINPMKPTRRSFNGSVDSS